MPDLLVGGERPRNLILGMHPETGIPGIVRDVYYGSDWIWSYKVDDYAQMYKRAGVYRYNLPSYPVRVSYVLVGGGGGGQAGNGGNRASGKGGGVGKIASNTITSFSPEGDSIGVTGGEVVVTVGAGGSGGTSSHGYGATGGISKIEYESYEDTAAGGGRGGSADGSSTIGGTRYSSFNDRHGYSHPVADEELGRGGNGGSGGIFNSYDHGQRGIDGYGFILIRKVMPYD